ncbi:MAG: hypothetical protein IPL20_18600 [Saprospiraceae bacterium]|nr:hypothetical protein [Saprospiraceae bacterium]
MKKNYTFENLFTLFPINIYEVRLLSHPALFHLFFHAKNDKPSTQQGAQKQGGGDTLKVQGIIAGQVSRTENITTTGTVLPGEKVDIKAKFPEESFK